MAKKIIAQNPADNNDDVSLPDASVLWGIWWDAMLLLRPAFKCVQAFFWFAVLTAGLGIGTDPYGIMRVMRALRLQRRCYDSLIHNVHSEGINVPSLAALWGRVVMPRLFGDKQVRVGGRRVLVADGIKKPKRGRKMPAVKLVHQESDNKAEYTMAHSFQVVGALVHSLQGVVAVPLAGRIDEGVVLCNALKETLLTKLLTLTELVAGGDPYILVADAYYASGVIIKGVLKNDNDLVTRMRSDAVAHALPVQEGPRKRGRPKKYGKKIKLTSLFDNPASMLQVASPVYGEKDVMIRYGVHDLFWKPAGCIVRFVAVKHPSRGCCVFMSTDTTLDAVEIIRLYGLRFKLEYSFKQAVHTIGTFSYHFWMKKMTPLKRNAGTQYLHRKSPEYRQAVARKLRAYHVFVQAGLIAHGLMQYLAATYPKRVWNAFGPWLRTIRPGVPPSEFVTAGALRESLPHFLADSENSNIFAKFIAVRRHQDKTEIFRMAA
jgi:hypothetical protein